MRGNGTPYSTRMTEFGVVDLRSGESFHGVLWPTEPFPEKPNYGWIPEDAYSFDEYAVMADFKEWLAQFEGRIVGVSDNNSYDFGNFNYNWDRIMNEPSPFGHSSRRIGDFYAGTEVGSDSGRWTSTSRWKKFRKTKHTHNPVDDARGNREALLAILEQYDQEV